MRKLREESTVIEKEVTGEEFADVKLPSKKIVRTFDGKLAEAKDQSEFDLNLIKRFKPYNPLEELPAPIFKTNKKGIKYIFKQAEPRFKFEGDMLVKIYRGIGGVKKSPFWRYRALNPDRSKNIQAVKIRNEFRRIGIPGA